MSERPHNSPHDSPHNGPHDSPHDSLLDAMRMWSRANRGLRWALWVNVGLLVFAAVAMPFDHRRILGLNPWIKPMKFDLQS